MNDPSPAPDSTRTVSRDAAYFFTASGINATRRSFGAVSFGTARVGRLPAAAAGAGSVAAFGAFGAREALGSIPVATPPNDAIRIPRRRSPADRTLCARTRERDVQSGRADHWPLTSGS